VSKHPGSPPTERSSAPPEFDARRFGATGDGRTLDTAAINAAINAAHAVGGGTVVLPAGDYLCHSIRLQSRITLELRAGATLIAADPPPPGQPGGYDAPEDGPPNHFQDFGHSRFRNSLLWGENLEHVTLRGPGRIYGRGLSRGNGRIALPVGVVAPHPPGHLPDVLEADGDFEPFPGPLTPGPFGYPHAKDTLPAGVGNKAIALRECRQVTISDLTILHGGHFAILAAACDNLVIDRVMIDTNRDGIDVDACSNVRISNCSVNSPWDDGICIKSSCGFGGLRPVENVTISDCFVSGFTEGTLYDGTRERVIRHRGGPIGRIKLGTEASGGFRNIAISNCVFDFCRGLALEQVDGAPMEDIVVTNLVMREVMNAPVFIRLGARLRAPGAAKPGTASRISISDVVATDVSTEHGIFIAGLPGHPVTDVRLSGIRLHSRGGGTADDAAREVPELPAGYPEPMLFGTLPAWGLYVRHAERIQIRDFTLRAQTPERRPAIELDDVQSADLAGLRGTGEADWIITGGTTHRARDCDGLADT
jgi:parallel beta-helix repeat protein